MNSLIKNLIRSPLGLSAVLITLLCFGMALFAPWIAPYDPWDQTLINISYANFPPAWLDGGDSRFFLGTDSQGRDVLSVIIYGTRVSVMVGLISVALASMIGLILGLVCGYFGGIIDTIVMRIADVQLGFPAILVALLVNGIIRTVAGGELQQLTSILVVITAIVLASWVQFARTVRATTMVEAEKDYVMAARLSGASSSYIILRCICPNVLNPILVIAAIQFAIAILTEASLSFLGLGVPPTQPSLGSLIKVGSDYLFSGMWWIVVFPSIMLALIIMALNILGDWLRDALDPKTT